MSNFAVTSSPHLRDKATSQRIMQEVCLALGKEAAEKPENPCINCGRCVSACPMRLVPTKLDLLVRTGNYEDAEKQGVMNCMECGACTFACPAKRLLTQSCRTGKRIINANKKAAAAKAAAEAPKK